MATVAAPPTFAAAIPAATRPYDAGAWRNALFVGPFLLVFMTMLVVPLLWGLWLSTAKGDLFGFERWVGLANFARLLEDPIFIETVRNTFYFVLLTVPALTVAGLGLALV